MDRIIDSRIQKCGAESLFKDHPEVNRIRHLLKTLKYVPLKDLLPAWKELLEYGNMIMKKLKLDKAGAAGIISRFSSLSNMMQLLHFRAGRRVQEGLSGDEGHVSAVSVEPMRRVCAEPLPIY